MVIRTLLIIAVIIFCTELQAGPVTDKLESQPSVFDSFYDEEVLSVTLITDLEALINNRNGEDYQKAKFIYKDSQKKSVTWNIELKSRGKFRRRICDFPPLKLKFSKKELLPAGLNEHNDLKLVTHCLEDKNEGLDNVMREFLAYKMFQILTPSSYRVQLVEIEYQDSEGHLRPVKRFGFLLEDTDEMAERLGGEVCETCMNPGPERLDPYEENLMSVFQYMIGNSDWSLMMARNVKYIQRPSGQLLPVPFDFDFSGLVGAAYAIPNRDYGQWNIESRIFLGFQPEQEVLFHTLYSYSQKKKDLYAAVKQCKGLKQDTRIFIIAYLDRFFYAIENGTEEELQALFTPAVMQVPITPSDTIKTDHPGGIRQ